MTDAVEEGTFDPDARQIGRDGLSYVDFAAALQGEPDEGDDANIQRYLKQGRSEAFCREYRLGYEGALRSVNAVQAEGRFDAKDLALSRFVVARKAGEARACDLEETFTSEARGQGRNDARAAFPGWRPEEIADTPRNRAHIAGFARATFEHGEYHEA